MSLFNNFCKSGRIQGIDLVKLFASFLVICSHCMMQFLTPSTSNPIFNFVWLTQMPLFMFASGFVNNKPEKIFTLKLYFWKLLKNALSLLIPCMTYLLITCLIDAKSVISAFVLFFQDPQTNLWFLWVLFIFHLFFDFGLYMSNKFKNCLKPIIPVALLLSISLFIAILMLCFTESFDFNILSLKLIAYYAPFYCFGFIFHLIINSGLTNKKTAKIIVYIVIAIAFVVLNFECLYFKSIYSFDDSNIKYLLIRITGSVSSILVCLFVADLLVNLKIFLFISKLGAFSLQSYYFHLIYLRYLTYSSNLIWAQWLISLGSVFLLMTMIAATLIVIYFIPYLHLLLFGKSFSFYKFEKRLPIILR